jgi:sugar phosphate permease
MLTTLIRLHSAVTASSGVKVGGDPADIWAAFDPTHVALANPFIIGNDAPVNPSRTSPASAIVLTDPLEIQRRYAWFRPRILLWTTLGYGMYYFVRKNLSVAMPVMESQLGIHKSDLGLFLTLHGLLYGVSKFINGMLTDRSDARKFMAAGLIASALMNICFGLSSSVVTLGVFWMLNGWFQGMGYPPCARLLTHWFSPKELATKMAMWNASHSIGAGAIVVLCGYLVQHFGDWRICFFVPAVLAIIMSGALLRFLRDAPESVGLPEVEGTREGHSASENYGALLRQRVFTDKYIWIVSGANFFVYTIRYAVLDWGPTMLHEFKGIELSSSAWMVAGFELSGLAGMLVSGWLTDRIFRGRAAPISLMFMLLCGVAIFLFWKSPQRIIWLNTLLLMAAGFFIYGPQALVAVIVANRATKRAAATAVGLTSVFGYASTVLSGWGLGVLVHHHGWSAAFGVLVVVAILGAMCFAAALPASAHGYTITDRE